MRRPVTRRLFGLAVAGACASMLGACGQPEMALTHGFNCTDGKIERCDGTQRTQSRFSFSYGMQGYTVIRRTGGYEEYVPMMGLSIKVR